MGYNAATRTFDTLTDLRNQRGAPNAKANLLGYAAIGDGGQGEFYWDPSSIAADDGGTIFSPTVGSGAGRWRRNYVGCVYPRWFGAKGDDATNDTSALLAAIAVAAPKDLFVDGENKFYKISGLDMPADTRFINIGFNTTAGTYGLKIGDIGQAPTAYKRNLSLINVTIKGSSTYALIVSTITGVDISNIKFQNCNCANDVFYLLNTYDSKIDRLTFTGCSTGVGGACIHIPAGMNGVKIDTVYTSAFTDLGLKVTGCASAIFSNFVIQGATTGMYFSTARGVTIENPYFENVVNPVEISNAEGEIDNFVITGGFWGGPYSSHPDISLNNNVYVRYIGSTSMVTMRGGKFDVSLSGTKNGLASVGGAAVINIYNPSLASGAVAPIIRDFLFREPTALSTAGFHVEYTRSGNSYEIVRRTGGIGNAHVAEYYDGSSNLIKTAWSPPIVGSSATADSLYMERLPAIKVGSYTLTNADDVVRFNTTSGTLIATLPITNMVVGKRFTVKKTAGANNVSVVASGGVVTIDGAANYQVTSIGEVACFQWDGSNYIVVLKSSTGTSGAQFAENTTSTNSLSLTNATLNAAYPVGSYPIGSKIAYSNLSDEGMSSNVAECTRLTASTWYITITPYKAS